LIKRIILFDYVIRVNNKQVTETKITLIRLSIK